MYAYMHIYVYIKNEHVHRADWCEVQALNIVALKFLTLRQYWGEGGGMEINKKIKENREGGS